MVYTPRKTREDLEKLAGLGTVELITGDGEDFARTRPATFNRMALATSAEDAEGPLGLGELYNSESGGVKFSTAGGSRRKGKAQKGGKGKGSDNDNPKGRKRCAPVS